MPRHLLARLRGINAFGSEHHNIIQSGIKELNLYFLVSVVIGTRKKLIPLHKHYKETETVSIIMVAHISGYVDGYINNSKDMQRRNGILVQQRTYLRQLLLEHNFQACI